MEEKKTARRRYYDKAIRRFTVEFNRNTEADLLARFEQVPNKQRFIKDLLRKEFEKR